MSLWFDHASQLINARMLSALEDIKLSYESFGSEVVGEDLFKSFNGVRALRRYVIDLHNFPIGPFPQLLFFPELRRHLEILIQVVKCKLE